MTGRRPPLPGPSLAGRLFLSAALALSWPVPSRAGEAEVADRIRFDSGARLKYAYPLALDEADRRLFIGGYGSHNILALDLEGRAVVNEAAGIRYPHGLKFHPGTGRLYALAYDDSHRALLVIYDRSLREIRRVSIGSDAYSLALSADGATAYVGKFGALVAVDTEDGTVTPLANLTSYYYPFSVAFDGDRNRVLVVGTGWFYASGAWVLRSAVLEFDLALGALGRTLVLGDDLFSFDAALDRDELWVANLDDNSLSVVDVARWEVLDKVAGVSCPQRLVLHPGRKWVYVIDNYLDRFHVVDRVHRVLVKTIYPGDDPSGLVFDSRGRCYTANYWSHDVAVVDLETEEVLDRIALTAASPHSLFYEPEDRRLYVTNGSSNGIFVMDPASGRVLDTLVMPDGAHGGPLAVLKSLRRLFVADDWRGGVAVYPLDTRGMSYQASHAERKLIPLSGAHPSGIAQAPGNRLCVPFVKGDRLVLGLVNALTETVEAEIDLGPGLQTGGVAVNPDKERAYVADFSGARVIAVDLKEKKVLGSVSVERQPKALAVHPVTGYVYVCQPGSHSLAVVADDPLETLGYVDVGRSPSAVAFSPSKARVYVLNAGDGTLSILNELEHKVVETLPVEGDGQSLILDPSSEEIFLANASGGQVTKVKDKFQLSPRMNDASPPPPETEFRLRQAYAYPNPARGADPVLRAEVGVADAVRFQVFDVSGVLVHEAALSAPPELRAGAYLYEYRWDVSSAAPGVYLVVMQARKAGQPDIRATFKAAVLK